MKEDPALNDAGRAQTGIDYVVTRHDAAFF